MQQQNPDYDQRGSRSPGCSTGGSTSTVSGYIRPLPVFNSTTRSSDLIQPDSLSLIAALKVAAPSGQMIEFFGFFQYPLFWITFTNFYGGNFIEVGFLIFKYFLTKYFLL